MSDSLGGPAGPHPEQPRLVYAAGLRGDATGRPSRYTRAMTNAPDLTGRQFGRLTVLHTIHKRMRRGYPQELCLCQCACGTTPLVHPTALLDGSVTSCGTCARAADILRATTRAIPTETTRQTCPKCKSEPLPLEAFALHSSGKYGRELHCKRCVAQRRARYYIHKKADRLKLSSR